MSLHHLQSTSFSPPFSLYDVERDRTLENKNARVREREGIERKWRLREREREERKANSEERE